MYYVHNVNIIFFFRVYMKQTLYDRDEFKLIQRVCEIRESNPDIKVSEILKPYTQDEVYKVEVEY